MNNKSISNLGVTLIAIVTLALGFFGYTVVAPGEAPVDTSGLTDQLTVAQADLASCNATLDTNAVAYDQLNIAYQDTVALQNQTATELGLCQAQLEDYLPPADSDDDDTPAPGVDLEPQIPACTDFVIVVRDGQAATWKVKEYNKKGAPVMIKDQTGAVLEGDVFLVYGHTEKDLNGDVICTGAVTADGGGQFYEIVGPHFIGLYLRVQDVDFVIE